MADKLVALLRRSLLAPLENKLQDLLPHALELEMHPAVLRFTFGDDAGIHSGLEVCRA
jgi:hypothetical protein